MRIAIWTGTVSNDWTNPDNWSEGIVPDQDTIVIINNDYSEIFIPEEVVVFGLVVENCSAYISLGGDLILTGEGLDLFTGVGEIRTNGNSIFCVGALIGDGFTVDIADGEFVCGNLDVYYLENLSSSGTKDSGFSFNSSSKLIVSWGQILNKLSDYIELAPEVWEEFYNPSAPVYFASIAIRTMIEEVSNIVPLFPDTILRGRCLLRNVLNSKTCFTSLSLEPDLILQTRVPEAVNELYLVTTDKKGTSYPSCVEVGACFISGQEGNLFNLLGSFVGQEKKVAWVIKKDTGIIETTYTNLANSTTEGGAVFKALTRNGNVDGGNNEGWIFQDNVTFSNLTVIEKETDSAKIAVDILEYSGEQASLFTSDPRDESSTYVFMPYARKTFSIKNRKGGKQYRFDLLNTVPESETPEYIFYHDLIEGLIQGISLETDCVYFQCNPSETSQYYDLILCEDEIEVDRIHIAINVGF